MSSKEARVIELVKQITAKEIYLDALENAVADEEEYFFDTYYVPEDPHEYYSLIKVLTARALRYDVEIAQLEDILLQEADGV